MERKTSKRPILSVLLCFLLLFSIIPALFDFSEAPEQASAVPQYHAIAVLGDISDGEIYKYDTSYPPLDITFDDDSSSIRVGQYFDESNYYMYRGYVSFDTSFLPDDTVVQSAILSLKTVVDSSDTDFWLEVTSRGNFYQPIFGELSTSDWSCGTELITYMYSTNFVAGSYRNLTVSTLDVTLTDKTQFELSSNLERNLIEPIGEEYVSFGSAEFTGSTPILFLTYVTGTDEGGEGEEGDYLFYENFEDTGSWSTTAGNSIWDIVMGRYTISNNTLTNDYLNGVYSNKSQIVPILGSWKDYTTYFSIVYINNYSNMSLLFRYTDAGNYYFCSFLPLLKSEHSDYDVNRIILGYVKNGVKTNLQTVNNINGVTPCVVGVSIRDFGASGCVINASLNDVQFIYWTEVTKKHSIGKIGFDRNIYACGVDDVVVYEEEELPPPIAPTNPEDAIFIDRFDSGTLDNWDVPFGSWSASSYNLRGTANDYAQILLKSNVDTNYSASWVNYDVWANYTQMQAYGQYTTYLRYQNNSNYYSVTLAPRETANGIKQIIVRKVINNITTTISNLRQTFVLPQIVKITINNYGDNLIKFVVQIGTTIVVNILEPTRNFVSGGIGFYKNKYTVTFDDVMVINRTAEEQNLPEPPTSAPYPWLHIEGGYFRDYLDRIVELTGVSIQDLTLADKLNCGNSSTAVYAYLQDIKNTGANHIRLQISLYERWYNVTGHTYYRTNIDTIVNACKALRLYCYIDFHYGSSAMNTFMTSLLYNTTYGAWTYARTNYTTAVLQVVNRYKTNPYVFGYQNWAEPAFGNFTSGTYSVLFYKWRDWNLELANKVHEISTYPIWIVVCPGYYPHTDVDTYWMNNPLPTYNIAYGYQQYIYDHAHWHNSTGGTILNGDGTDVLQESGTDDWYWDYVHGNFAEAKVHLETFLYNREFRMSGLGYATIHCEFAWWRNVTETSLVLSNIKSIHMPYEDQIERDWYEIYHKYYQSWTTFCWGSGNSHWYLLWRLTPLDLAPNAIIMKDYFRPIIFSDINETETEVDFGINSISTGKWVFADEDYITFKVLASYNSTLDTVVIAFAVHPPTSDNILRANYNGTQFAAVKYDASSGTFTLDYRLGYLMILNKVIDLNLENSDPWDYNLPNLWTENMSAYRLFSFIYAPRQEEVVVLGSTSSSVVSDILTLTIPVKFTSSVLDDLNVDVYSWANRTDGSYTSWNLTSPDAFNIYNYGGLSYLESSGVAGRTVGGDTFDLYTDGGAYEPADIYETSFENEEGSTPSNWWIFGKANTTYALTQDNMRERYTNEYNFILTDSSFSSFAYVYLDSYYTTGEYGEGTFSWQTYIRLDQNDKYFELRAEEDSLHGYYVVEFNSTGCIRAFDADGYPVYLGTYAADTWYNLTVRFDIDATTYDVYLDDALLGSGSTVFGDYDRIRYFGYGTGEDHPTSEGVYQLDDIKIWKDFPGGYGGTVLSTIVWKNLQHVKSEFTIEMPIELYTRVVRRQSPRLVWGSLDDVIDANATFTFGLAFYYNNTWVQGIQAVMFPLDTCHVEAKIMALVWQVDWYWIGSYVKSDIMYSFPLTQTLAGYVSTSFNLDLWFNQANASSLICARITPKFYAIKDGSNPWLQWMTGSQWNTLVDKANIANLYNLNVVNGTVIHAQSLKLMEFYFGLHTDSNYYINSTEWNILEYNRASAMVGVETPRATEPRMPSMPNTGLLANIINFVTATFNGVVAPAVLSLWATFIAFMDTVFSWAGWTNGFSQIVAWISQFLSYMVTAIGYIPTVLTSIYSLLAVVLPTMFSIFTGWISGLLGVFTLISSVINSVEYGGQSLVAFMSPFVELVVALLPILVIYWILSARDTEGAIGRAKMVAGIVTGFVGFMIRVGEFVYDIIFRLIEAIPVAE